MELKNVLITGANGMVGSYVHFGHKTDIDTLDVRSIDSVKAGFEKYKPSVVLHLAAETDVDLCAKNPVHADEVNALGTKNVAMMCEAFNARLVYVSTASVFDGKRTTPYTVKDEPHPSNTYAASKYAGECFVRAILPASLIVRAGWMFGGGPGKDKKFVGKIMPQLAQDEIKAVTDKRGSLTFAKDLIDAICGMIRSGKTGTAHLVQAGVPTRYEIACEIVRMTQANPRVIPVDSSYFNLAAARPSLEALDAGSDALRDWRDALKEYIQTEWKDYLDKS